MFKWLFKKKGCAKHMNNKLEVIGIDHGWSMMKTISQVFVTGVKEITTTPALFGDVLEYEGKFYKVGTVRQEVKDTKVEDDSFYLLTLAAVAKELGEVGTLLTNVVTELKSFDEEESKGFLGIFKKASNKVESMKAKYSKAEENVNQIVKALDNHQVQLLKDVAILDKMYDLNLTYFKELSIFQSLQTATTCCL